MSAGAPDLPSRPTLRAARRLGAEALAEATRRRLAAALARAGGRASGVERHPALRRALLRAIPAALERRFDPDAAEGLDATFSLAVLDPRGGPPACFALVVQDRRCVVRPGEAADAVAGAAISAGDLVRLSCASVGWPELLSSGRLVLIGNPFEGLRFPMLFRLPAGRR